jgi:sterol desaturase/sphingolipid hydroxylase (fatty acid hydroxylase superfamily)
MDYLYKIGGAFTGYFDYLMNEMLFRTDPWWKNYFWWLVMISLFFWLIEIVFPWRKNQPIIRKDFWLDGFYMFFNFFLLSLIGYNAISMVVVDGINSLFDLAGASNKVAQYVAGIGMGWKLLFAFLLKDFIQWNVHRLLHRVEWLWQFHKVHHSVKQMGFAAHLRYHWMERFVYNGIQYIPMALLGFGIEEFFAAHMIALSIGHFNHTNVNLPLGPLKYILNNPQMHIWHHAKEQPSPYGTNFGISLSIWDYIFRTNWIPGDGKDVELGFPDEAQFPKDFVGQELYPFKKPKE